MRLPGRSWSLIDSAVHMAAMDAASNFPSDQNARQRSYESETLSLNVKCVYENARMDGFHFACNTLFSVHLGSTYLEQVAMITVARANTRRSDLSRWRQEKKEHGFARFGLKKYVKMWTQNVATSPGDLAIKIGMWYATAQCLNYVVGHESPNSRKMTVSEVLQVPWLVLAYDNPDSRPFLRATDHRMHALHARVFKKVVKSINKTLCSVPNSAYKIPDDPLEFARSFGRAYASFEELMGIQNE